MRFNIANLLDRIGITDTLYWGKRVVRALPQPGSFKSHSVVVNWAEPERIRIDLRAGLTGKTLSARELANYPLQFQSDTFFELAVKAETDEGDEKSGDAARGRAGSGSKGGGGGRKPGLRADDRLSGLFSSAHSEKIPTHARLSKGVVMGMEIGQGALERVFDMFCDQIKHARVLATDLLASAGKAITRFTPPPFMAPRGDEDKVYKYDREKNEVMFGAAPT
jgi:hypothetical protein